MSLRVGFLGVSCSTQSVFVMATFHRFEDIDAWQKARELTRAVYAVSRSGWFSKDFALRDQIRRASISVMSNIAEGFERGGNKEFRQFLSTAKGSAGEVRAQRYVALDQQYLTPDTFEHLSDLTIRTPRMISGLMTYLQKSGFKGPKFKG